MASYRAEIVDRTAECFRDRARVMEQQLLTPRLDVGDRCPGQSDTLCERLLREVHTRPNTPCGNPFADFGVERPHQFAVRHRSHSRWIVEGTLWYVNPTNMFV